MVYLGEIRFGPSRLSARRVGPMSRVDHEAPHRSAAPVPLESESRNLSGRNRRAPDGTVHNKRSARMNRKLLVVLLMLPLAANGSTRLRSLTDV